MLEINADNEVRRSNCEITPAAIPVIETYPAQDAVRVVPFDGHPVRTGGDPKNPWFCVLDVLKAIDDKPREGKKYNVTEATKDLDEDELILNELVDIRGKKQVMQCVYKSGLFYLVGNSRKPSSMRFKRWVRKEVLVEIDQTGSYNGGAQLTVQRRDPMAIIERIADLATNDHVQAMELRNNMSALAATMTMLSGILAKQDALIKAEIGNVQAKVDHTSSVQSALIAHTNDRFAGIDGEINALKQAQYTVPRFVPTSRPIVPTMTVPPPERMH